MKSLKSGLLAAAIAMTSMGFASLNAEAATFSSADRSQMSPLIHQARSHDDRHDRRADRHNDRRRHVDRSRSERRGAYHRGFERRGNYHYYNGHRGSRAWQRGYRQYNGWWFPPAAFLGGVYVAPPPVVVPRVRARDAAHVQWCQNRWRSYRISDNTFQPSRGSRQYCISPYGG